MEWVAQYYVHDNDYGDRPLIKIGIKKDRHLMGICFDFNKGHIDIYATSRDEAIEKIKARWGGMKTFKLLIEEDSNGL